MHGGLEESEEEKPYELDNEGMPIGWDDDLKPKEEDKPEVPRRDIGEEFHLPEKQEETAIAEVRDEIGGFWVKRSTRCTVCNSEHVEDIHKKRKEGLTLRDVSTWIKTTHRESISHSIISKHFNYHFLITSSVLNNLGLTNKKTVDGIFDTSIHKLITGLESGSVSFMEFNKYVVKSKLEQLLQYESYIDEIEEELDEEMFDPITNSRKKGYLSPAGDFLVTRLAVFQKNADVIKTDIAKISHKIQEISLKSDKEYLKQTIDAITEFVVNKLIELITLYINEQQKNEVFDNETSTVLRQGLVAIFKQFDGEFSADFLYNNFVDVDEDGQPNKNK